MAPLAERGGGRISTLCLEPFCRSRSGLTVSCGTSLSPRLALGLQERKRRDRLGSTCNLTAKISEGLPAGRPLSFRCVTSIFSVLLNFGPVGQFCDSRANHLDVVGFFCLGFFFFC